MARLSTRASDTILSSYRVQLPLGPGSAPGALPIALPRLDNLPGLRDEPDPRRKRLWELDPTLHCSIIGTCLTQGELREILRRIARSEGLDRHPVGPRAAQPRRPARRAPRWAGQIAAQGAGPAPRRCHQAFRGGKRRELARSTVAGRAGLGRHSRRLLGAADASVLQQAPGDSCVRRSPHAVPSRGRIQSSRHPAPESSRGGERTAADRTVGPAPQLAPCARRTRCAPAAARGAAPHPGGGARRARAGASAHWRSEDVVRDKLAALEARLAKEERAPRPRRGALPRRRGQARCGRRTAGRRSRRRSPTCAPRPTPCRSSCAACSVSRAG